MHLHLSHPHRPAGEAPPDALGLRARVWRHQSELDRDLAAGAPPGQSREHEARARQLLSKRCRRELVAELDAALAKAEHAPAWHSASLPVQTAAISAARTELSSLRRALLECDALTLRGAALAACLLSAPQSPLYHACPGPTVAQLATAATAALQPIDAPHTDALPIRSA
jgi:hypothetical protein